LDQRRPLDARNLGAYVTNSNLNHYQVRSLGSQFDLLLRHPSSEPGGTTRTATLIRLRLDRGVKRWKTRAASPGLAATI
jgi:hypothetical protein